jgi:hypothetical protein
MTKREALNYVLSLDLPQDVCETLTKMSAQLEKQAQADRKPSKKEVERKDANEAMKADILVALADGSHLTVSDLIKRVPSLANATTQKVSALMRLLKLDNKVDKEVVKGKTLFFMI